MTLGPEWQPISTAATTGPVVWVDVWNGKEIVSAHFACDMSGEAQPPFRGWFRKAESSGFIEVYPRPTHWRPRTEVTASPRST